MVWATQAFATLSYWDGPGYGQDNYSGEDGIPGQDGKGVEIRGAAAYGLPGTGGNEKDYVSGASEWMVFEVISDTYVNPFDMRIRVYEPSVGWQNWSMQADSNYGGAGYRYWYQVLVTDQSFGNVPPSKEIKYYFQDFDTFECLPASGGSGGPYLDAPNFEVSTVEPSFVVELSDTPADVLGGELGVWDVDVTNEGDASGTMDLWMEVTGPLSVELLRKDGLTLDAGATFHMQYVCTIVAHAPVGTYTVTGKVGSYRSEVVDSDAFDTIMEE